MNRLLLREDAAVVEGKGEEERGRRVKTSTLPANEVTRGLDSLMELINYSHK
jgi:hypothetical protein